MLDELKLDLALELFDSNKLHMSRGKTFLKVPRASRHLPYGLYSKSRL